MKKNSKAPSRLPFFPILSLLFFLNGTAFAQAQGNSNHQEKAYSEHLQDGERMRNNNTANANNWYLTLQPSLLLKKPEKIAFSSFSATPSLQFSLGYRFRNWLQTGFGAGRSYYKELDVYPIFAEIRGTIIEEKISPYYCIKAGGSLAKLKQESEQRQAWGEYMTELQAGIAVKYGRIRWLIGGGYHLQKVKVKGGTIGWRRGGLGNEVQHRSFRRILFSSSVKYNF